MQQELIDSLREQNKKLKAEIESLKILSQLDKVYLAAQTEIIRSLEGRLARRQQKQLTLSF